MLNSQVTKPIDGEGGNLFGLGRFEIEKGLKARWESVRGNEGKECGLLGEWSVNDDDEEARHEHHTAGVPWPAVEQVW